MKVGSNNESVNERLQLARAIDSLERNQILKKYATGSNVLEIRTDKTPSSVSLIRNSVVVNVKLAEVKNHQLPVDDESQDLVLAMYVLEHARDFRATLTEWFRVVRVGGYLVIAVSHKEFQNRSVSLIVSRNNLPLKPYTSKMLLTELELSLDHTLYSLREFKEDDELYEYSLSPNQRARGIYDILMVLRKRAKK